MDELSGFLKCAERSVREAGDIARRFFRRPDIASRQKQAGDFVTEADERVEEHIIRSLSDEFPGHSIISEEAGHVGGESEHVWILDPIDGTRYFISGVPLYSISLALRHRDELVLGVVFNPETDELFSAVRGEGATLNDEKIHCSSRTSLADSMVCLEIPHRRFPPALVNDVMEKTNILVRNADRVRILGVSALGLCYCAAGGFDAYANLSGASKIWDVAAGQVILREAGGTFTNLAGGRMIGGPPELHDELLELLG